jgi:hypothetical protein
VGPDEGRKLGGGRVEITERLEMGTPRDEGHLFPGLRQQPPQ